MADIAEVMFEVFNGRRLDILQLLSGKSLRYTDLSHQVQASDGELSRNLKRLLDKGLIERRPSGTFEITPLAGAILRFIPSLKVVTKHRDYFKSHQITDLPKELILRLDDWSEADFLSEPFQIFGAVERVFQSVKRLFHGIWVFGRALVTNEELSHGQSLREAILKNGAEVRALLLEKELPTFSKAFPDFLRLAQVRVLENTPVSLAIGDTSAIVFFADRTGRLDFNYAFFGEDKNFIRWCHDLFVKYWEEARIIALPTSF